MLLGYEFLLLCELALLVYCALDVITTPRGQARNLPKPLWLLLVVLFPLGGGIGWLVAGRPRRARPGDPPVAAAAAPPPRPGPVRPDDDEDFLRSLRDRAEEQRRRAREQQEPPA